MQRSNRTCSPLDLMNAPDWQNVNAIRSAVMRYALLDIARMMLEPLWVLARKPGQQQTREIRKEFRPAIILHVLEKRFQVCAHLSLGKNLQPLASIRKGSAEVIDGHAPTPRQSRNRCPVHCEKQNAASDPVQPVRRLPPDWPGTIRPTPTATSQFPNPRDMSV